MSLFLVAVKLASRDLTRLTKGEFHWAVPNQPRLYGEKFLEPSSTRYVKIQTRRRSDQRRDVATHTPSSHMEENMSDMDKMTSGNLINAEKVHGTDVYNAQGEKLGSIEDLVLDKVEGRVQYAVLSFGGFLGLGDKHYPLPWEALKYDTLKKGYMVNLDKRQLENAPAYEADETIDWTPDYGREVDDYYKRPGSWQ